MPQEYRIDIVLETGDLHQAGVRSEHAPLFRSPLLQQTLAGPSNHSTWVA